MNRSIRRKKLISYRSGSRGGMYGRKGNSIEHRGTLEDTGTRAEKSSCGIVRSKDERANLP